MNRNQRMQNRQTAASLYQRNRNKRERDAFLAKQIKPVRKS